VSAIALVLLLTLSQEFAKSGALNSSSYFQTMGVLLQTGYHWLGYGAAPMIFGLGALMYYLVFYQTRLVPRWLSGWGIVGVILCMGTSLLVMLSFIGPFSTVQVVFNLPIAVQEMALAIWLIIKGFKTASVVSLSERTDTIPA